MDSSVKTLETRRKKASGRKVYKGNKNTRILRKKMVISMEDGFKKEQNARQQVQSEIAQGFKNEEHARQLVQKELAIMKHEIKNLSEDRPELEWDWGPVPQFGHRHSPLGAVKLSVQGKWKSKVGSQISQRIAIRVSRMEK